MSGKLEIRCPSCHQGFAVNDRHVGRKVKCSGCGTAFTVAGSRTTASRCPGCGSPLAPDTVICLECGMNLKTGQSVRAQREPATPAAEEEAEEEEALTPAEKLCVLLGDWVPGIFRPSILIASIIVVLIGLGVMAGCVVLLAMRAVFLALILGAGGLIIYGQGLALLISGQFYLITDALAEFDGNKWCLFLILLLIPFGVIFAFIGQHATP